MNPITKLKSFVESVSHVNTDVCGVIYEALSELEKSYLASATNETLPSRPSPDEIKEPSKKKKNLSRNDIKNLVVNTAKKYNVDPALGLSIVHKESMFNPTAGSSKGAYGLMQLMKPTARELGVDRENPVENVDGGMRYISKMMKQFNDERLGLAAYNSGPRNLGKAIRKSGGSRDWDVVKKNLITRPSAQRETIDYVDKITKMRNGLYSKYGVA